MKRSKLIAYTAIIVSICLTCWIAYQMLSFRVSRVDPEGIVHNRSEKVEFFFNRDIDTDSDFKVTIVPDLNVEYEMGKNSIIIILKEQAGNTKYRFEFSGLRSNSGKKYKKVSKTIKFDYVYFKNLSEKEQARLINESDSGQDEYPIINGTLPHASANYGLGYLLPIDTGNDKLTITVRIYSDRGTNEPIEDYNRRLDNIKNDIERYISDKGYDINDYYVFYENPYLSKYDIVPSDVENEID